MTSPADMLAAWLAAQGGAAAFRDILQRAPVALRRKASAEAAISALIAEGRAEETSRRPRAFRVAQSVAATQAAQSVAASETLAAAYPTPSAVQTVADADPPPIRQTAAWQTVAADAPVEAEDESLPRDVYEALAMRHAASTGETFDREAHKRARADVEAQLDGFAAEREARLDWWREAPTGWPHFIFSELLVDGKRCVIDLKGGKESTER